MTDGGDRADALSDMLDAAAEATREGLTPREREAAEAKFLEAQRKHYRSIGVPIRTRGEVIRYRVAVTAIFLTIVAGFFYLQDNANDQLEQARYDSDKTQAEAAVAGCERANEGVKDPLYDGLGTIADTFDLFADQAGFSDRERFTLASAADDLREQQDNQVEAASNAPLHKGSPQVDCNDQYPLPDPTK